VDALSPTTLPAGCGQAEAATSDFAGHPSPLAAAQTVGIELPASVLRSVASRQFEFLAGRAAARAALRAAGLAEPPQIAIGPDRAPLWPAGFVGSITHSAGSAWAVAARDTLLRAVGIDMERIVDAALMREIGHRVMTSADMQLALPHWPATRLFSLVFSAKESAYKCLAAHGGGPLDFPDLCLVDLRPVDVDPAGLYPAQGAFRVRLLRANAPPLPVGFELAGGYRSSGQQLRTWACWPPS
jgi:enterobactin synthetase component D